MRRTVTNSNWIEIGRATKISRVRPNPPLGLTWEASTGTLSWEAPTRDKNITHYRVYNGQTGELLREVPAGQRRIQDNLTAGMVLVVSYNALLDLESTPVSLTDTIEPAGGGGGTGAIQYIYTVTVDAHPFALNEPANDDNGLALSSAVVGDRLAIWCLQDATGGWDVTFSAAFKVRGGNLITTAGAYTVFEFLKKSLTNPKWWQTGGPIGYAS